MRSVNPVLSVILPAFNCEKYLNQAIVGILNQTFSDFELVIGDDASTDSTRQIISAYAMLDKRISVSNNRVNQGKVETANRLLNLCKGEYITVHDGDDISHPLRFEKQINLLRKDVSLVMCGTSFEIITAGGTLFKNVMMPTNFNDIVKGIGSASQFHGPTMMIKKQAMQGVLYRSYFRDFNEDCDLAFRLIEKGRCTNLPDILYSYRLVPGSLSKTITAEKKNLYRMAVSFHEQRKFSGTDDLINQDSEAADQKLKRLLLPYEKDVSLIHRENAAFLMYYKLNRSAILNAWKACLLKPFYFDNWRTLQYCLRKTFLKI
jgi:glycosyltransferase involved in cell wall biosynthesis